MKPLIAFTMGDPAGIGPEIVLKTVLRTSVLNQYYPVVYGDYACLKKHRRLEPVGRAQPWGGVLDILSRGRIPVVDFRNVPMKGFRFGVASAENGRASGEYISAAIVAAIQGRVHAVVTAPINKKSFAASPWGKKFIGHTEMFAKLTNSPNVALMLVHGNLRAVHVTSHVPLKQVPRLVTPNAVQSTIEVAWNGLQKMGISKPKLAVCGLNPHAGDDGVLGEEERTKILPAIRKCVRKKINVSGPFSADAVWPKVFAGTFDAGIAMYHDQGQIAVKLMSFMPGKKGNWQVGGVNVTLGLPIIRTSVAHGTAFDIAGKGIASSQSMEEAVTLAVRMAKQ